VRAAAAPWRADQNLVRLGFFERQVLVANGPFLSRRTAALTSISPPELMR
jgi:hypothetical protein